MAMNKKEQAELAAAKREARLRELIVLQPRIPPDIPAPVSEGETRGFDFNAYGSFLTVTKYESTVSAHYALDAKGRRIGCGRQRSVELYSSRELALEAAKRELVWIAAEAIIEKVEQYERNH